MKIHRNAQSVTKVRAEYLGTRFHEYLGKHRGEKVTAAVLEDEFDCTPRERTAGMRYARHLARDGGQCIPSAVPELGFVYVLLDDGVDPYPAVQAVAHHTRAKNGLERTITEHHQFVERNFDSLAPHDRPLVAALFDQRKVVESMVDMARQSEDRLAQALIESERLRRETIS